MCVSISRLLAFQNIDQGLSLDLCVQTGGMFWLCVCINEGYSKLKMMISFWVCMCRDSIGCGLVCK